jgi:hypothetical protein
MITEDALITICEDLHDLAKHVSLLADSLEPNRPINLTDEQLNRIRRYNRTMLYAFRAIISILNDDDAEGSTDDEADDEDDDEETS